MNFLRLAAVFTGGIFLGSRLGASGVKEGNAHQFAFTGLDGAPLPLSAYKGKALLVVNTASECGFTPQYEGLENLYKTYGADGLVVIAVPSNDFGEQEPGDAEAIRALTQGTYGITFPVTQKEHAVGAYTHPFFQWASAQAGFLGAPKWNFHKFLISPQGQFVDWFASTTKPESETLKRAIEATLPESTAKAA